MLCVIDRVRRVEGMNLGRRGRRMDSLFLTGTSLRTRERGARMRENPLGPR